MVIQGTPPLDERWKFLQPSYWFNAPWNFLDQMLHVSVFSLSSTVTKMSPCSKSSVKALPSAKHWKFENAKGWEKSHISGAWEVDCDGWTWSLRRQKILNLFNSADTLSWSSGLMGRPFNQNTPVNPLHHCVIPWPGYIEWHHLSSNFFRFHGGIETNPLNLYCATE